MASVERRRKQATRRAGVRSAASRITRKTDGAPARATPRRGEQRPRRNRDGGARAASAAQVAPLLGGGNAGPDSFARLASLFQRDPALIDLRLDLEAVLRVARASGRGGLASLDRAARDRFVSGRLPALVPAALGGEVAGALNAVAGRCVDPRDRRALALGRYFALRSELDGPRSAGGNPLWHLLFELTWAERRPPRPRRELLTIPAPESVARVEPLPPRQDPDLARAYLHATPAGPRRRRRATADAVV